MIIGYARVSTQEQNLDRQVAALEAAGVERIYTDRISTRKEFLARPEWSRMWDTLRAGDVLVVPELDRMGRDLRDLLEIVRQLEARGVTLRLLSGVFSGDVLATGTPEQRLSRDLLLTTAGAFAEYERAVNRSRTLEGLAAARKRGMVGGRKPKLTPLEAALVVSLYHDPSVTVASIAARFGVKPDTVRAYVARSQGLQSADTTKVQNGKRRGAITDAATVSSHEDSRRQPAEAPPSARSDPKAGRRTRGN